MENKEEYYRLLSKFEKYKGYDSDLFDGEDWSKFDSFLSGYELKEKENEQ